MIPNLHKLSQKIEWEVTLNSFYKASIILLLIQDKDSRGGKKEITEIEIFPGEWAVQVTYWAHQPWGVTQGRQAHLAVWWEYQEGCGKPDSPHEDCVHPCLPPRQGGQGGLKTAGHFPETKLRYALACAEQMCQAHLLHKLHIGTRTHLWDRQSSESERHLSGVEAVITGSLLKQEAH